MGEENKASWNPETIKANQDKMRADNEDFLNRSQPPGHQIPKIGKQPDPTPTVGQNISPATKMGVTHNLKWNDVMGEVITVPRGGYEKNGNLVGANESGIFIKIRGGKGYVEFIPWHELDGVTFPEYKI